MNKKNVIKQPLSVINLATFSNVGVEKGHKISYTRFKVNVLINTYTSTVTEVTVTAAACDLCVSDTVLIINAFYDCSTCVVGVEKGKLLNRPSNLPLLDIYSGAEKVRIYVIWFK